MKVIVAGLPKTGTKSMHAALEKLGYSVYDFAENIFILSEEYRKIVFEGWTSDDFRKMYENVDAVVDLPAYFFWDEIHKAFPDAKIILTMRDNEDEWVRSFEKQMRINNTTWLYRLMQFLSPTCRRAVQHTKLFGRIALGNGFTDSFGRGIPLNVELAKRCYRQHNAYVLHTAPKDKLLVYQCSEGWEPLCKFLGMPIPDEPFPHKNVGGSMVNTLVEDFPVFKKIKREIIVSSAVIFSTALITGIISHQYGLTSIYEQVCSYASCVYEKYAVTA